MCDQDSEDLCLKPPVRCEWRGGGGGQEGSARAEENQVIQTTQNDSHSLTLRMRCAEYQG